MRRSIRMTLQVPSPAQDEIGQPLPAGWVDVPSESADGKIAVNVLYQKGVEAVRAGAPASTVTVSLRMRFNVASKLGVTNAMRLVDGGTIYNITAVLPDMAKRRYVDLVCEVVNGS
jgi:SPP1 family predicted phage head-tail adaptor